MPYPAEAEDLRLIDALRGHRDRCQPLRDRLRAIEERRSTTAPAVYDRVRQETEEKLAQLAADANQLRTSVSAARARSEAELRLAQEEIEEIRFRNTLGEYLPDQFQALEHEKLGAIAARERNMSEIASLSAVLDAPAPVAAPARPAPPPPPPPAPPVAAANPVRSAPSEMEALFGAVGPAPARPAPGREALTRPHEPLAPPSAAPSRRAEETTQDLTPKNPGPAGKVPFPEAAARPFHPVLIVKTKDQDRGEDFYDLAPGHTLIGRAPENDIILLEESVSRRHAKLSVESNECIIEDMGSANGSYVNGDRLRPRQPRKLQDNDIIKLGQLLAIFRTSPED